MKNKIPSVVCLGGGTGLSTILKGLKKYPIDLTAIVTVADDGGSSGILREVFKMPPPGDIRKVLVSLSKNEKLFDELFNYRFKENAESLEGHTIGNLIIAALTEMHDNNFSSAIKYLSEFLNIEGKVIPICLTPLKLKAKYKDGSEAIGESIIPNAKKIIDEISYIEKVDVNQKTISSILNADIIVLSCGSLYTSLIPNLLFTEVQDALKKTKAKVIYVSNIMTQQGETDNFNVSEHITILEKYLKDDIIDIVIANDNYEISDKIKNKYKVEDSELVKVDLKEIAKLNKELYTANLINLDNGNVRHNFKLLAAHIYSIIINNN